MTDSLKSATLWGGVGGGETRRIALISSPPVKGYVWSTPRSNSSYPRITEPSLPRSRCDTDSSSCFPCWPWRWPAVRKPSHQHQRVFPTSLRAGRRRRRPQPTVQRTTALPIQCLHHPSRTGPHGEPADGASHGSRPGAGPYCSTRVARDPIRLVRMVNEVPWLSSSAPVSRRISFTHVTSTCGSVDRICLP
jgi:hypothetical protein